MRLFDGKKSNKYFFKSWRIRQLLLVRKFVFFRTDYNFALSGKVFLKHNLINNFMQKINPSELPFEQLCSLLADSALELIKMVEENKDGLAIRNKSREIEDIRLALEKKKETQKTP